MITPNNRTTCSEQTFRVAGPTVWISLATSVHSDPFIFEGPLGLYFYMFSISDIHF